MTLCNSVYTHKRIRIHWQTYACIVATNIYVCTGKDIRMYRLYLYMFKQPSTPMMRDLVVVRICYHFLLLLSLLPRGTHSTDLRPPLHPLPYPLSFSTFDVKPNHEIRQILHRVRRPRLQCATGRCLRVHFIKIYIEM